MCEDRRKKVGSWSAWAMLSERGLDLYVEGRCATHGVVGEFRSVEEAERETGWHAECGSSQLPLF